MRAVLLFPLTILHYIINFLWDSYWRLRPPERVAAKVISVGNITAGGSGKTSLACFIAQQFLAKGRKTAVVARGYGRLKSKPVVVSSELDVPWEECGDEPLVMARSLPGSRIYVDSSKTEAAKRAAGDGFEVIVVDDGFQHRRLHRDINIVCLNAVNPVGNGLLLPSGILREPTTALARADALVFVGDEQDFQSPEVTIPGGIPIFRACKLVVGMKDQAGESIEIPQEPVYAFCGLANPDSFFNSLRQVGCRVSGSRTYRDHHNYVASDIEKIARCVRESGAMAAITTLKDAVKLEKLWPAGMPLYYLQVAIRLENEDEFFRLIGV